NGDRGASYPSRDEFTSEGIPFVNAGHLSSGRVNFSEMNYITPTKYAQMGGAKLRSGDILFCLRGSVGKVAIFTGENGALASSLVALRSRSRKITSAYMLYVLSSQATSTQVRFAMT